MFMLSLRKSPYEANLLVFWVIFVYFWVVAIVHKNEAHNTKSKGCDRSYMSSLGFTKHKEAFACYTVQTLILFTRTPYTTSPLNPWQNTQTVTLQSLNVANPNLINPQSD